MKIIEDSDFTVIEDQTCIKDQTCATSTVHTLLSAPPLPIVTPSTTIDKIRYCQMVANAQRARAGNQTYSTKEASALPMRKVAEGMWVSDSGNLIEFEGISRKHIWKLGQRLRKDVATIKMAQIDSSGQTKISYLRPAQWRYVDKDGNPINKFDREFLNEKVGFEVLPDQIADLLLPEFRTRFSNGEFRGISSFFKGLWNNIKSLAPQVMPVVLEGIAEVVTKNGVVTQYAYPVRGHYRMLEGNDNLRFWGAALKFGAMLLPGLLKADESSMQDGMLICRAPAMLTDGAAPTLTIDGETFVAVSQRYDPMFAAKFAETYALGSTRNGFFSFLRNIVCAVVRVVTSIFTRHASDTRMLFASPESRLLEAQSFFARSGVTHVGVDAFGDDIVDVNVEPEDFAVTQGAIADTPGIQPVAVTYPFNPVGSEQDVSEGNVAPFVPTDSYKTEDNKFSDFGVLDGNREHLAGSRIEVTDDSVYRHDPADKPELAYFTAPTNVGVGGFDSTTPGTQVVNYQHNTLVAGNESNTVVTTVVSSPVTHFMLTARKHTFTVGCKADKNDFEGVVGSSATTDTTLDAVNPECYDFVDWDVHAATSGYKDVVAVFTPPNGGTPVNTTVCLYFGEDRYVRIVVTPSKCTYQINDVLAAGDINVYGVISDGTTSLLDSTQYIIEGFSSVRIGHIQLRVTHTRDPALTSVCEVKISDPIVRLQIDPIKTKYALDEQFSSSDIIVTGIRVSGATKVVTHDDYQLTSFKTTEIGEFEAFVIYKNRVKITEGYKFIVTSALPTSLEVTLSRTTYFRGEVFDPNTVTLTANYPDQSVTVPLDAITVLGYNSSMAGTRTLTFSYDNRSVTSTVEILEDSIVSISAKVSPGYVAEIGQSLVRENILVETVSASSLRVPVTDWEYNGFNQTLLTPQIVTITYSGKTTEVEIPMERPRFTGVSVALLTTDFPFDAPVDKNLIEVNLYDAYGNSRVAEASEYDIDVPHMFVPEKTGTTCRVRVKDGIGGELVGKFTAFFASGSAADSSIFVISNTRPWYNVGDVFDPATVTGYTLSADGTKTEVPITIGPVSTTTSGERIVTITW